MLGVTIGFLAQQVGSSNWALVFLYNQLDITICGWQPSLRALAAAAELTWEIVKITLFQSVMVYSTAYAVVSSTKTVEVTHLPRGTSSQKVELITLIRAFYIVKGQLANIYTDSNYAFLIVPTHSIVWRERGFLTKGTPIINRSFIVKLLEAPQFPAEAAIVHCWRILYSKVLVASDKARADSVA